MSLQTLEGRQLPDGVTQEAKVATQTAVLRSGLLFLVGAHGEAPTANGVARPAVDASARAAAAAEGLTLVPANNEVGYGQRSLHVCEEGRTLATYIAYRGI